MPVREVQRILTSAARVSILICSCDLVGMIGAVVVAGLDKTGSEKSPRVGFAAALGATGNSAVVACGEFVESVATGCGGRVAAPVKSAPSNTISPITFPIAVRTAFTMFWAASISTC